MAGFSGATMLGLLLLLGAGLIGFIVQQRMMHFMNTYSQEPAPYTGAEVARRMLEENGITDVRVISTPGQLTDHYNPVDKTVNLSETVYNQATVAAMAVAAHECGHASSTPAPTPGSPCAQPSYRSSALAPDWGRLSSSSAC